MASVIASKNPYGVNLGNTAPFCIKVDATECVLTPTMRGATEVMRL